MLVTVVWKHELGLAFLVERPEPFGQPVVQDLLGVSAMKRIEARLQHKDLVHALGPEIHQGREAHPVQGLLGLGPDRFLSNACGAGTFD